MFPAFNSSAVLRLLDHEIPTLIEYIPANSTSVPPTRPSLIQQVQPSFPENNPLILPDFACEEEFHRFLLSQQSWHPEYVRKLAHCEEYQHWLVGHLKDNATLISRRELGLLWLICQLRSEWNNDGTRHGRVTTLRSGIRNEAGIDD